MIQRNGYSRLSWIEERRLRRRAAVYGFLAVALLIAFLFWGLPAVPQFLGRLRGGDRSQLNQKSDLIAPPPPEINPPPLATNSAGLVLSGTSEPGSKVAIDLNGEPTAVAQAKSDGTFGGVKLTLTPGNNQIVAYASDAAGNRSQPSQQMAINLDTRSPVVSVDQPTDGQTISGSKQQEITVSGSVDKNVSLTLNGRYVVVESDGKFATPFSLVDGKNLLTLIATDSAGNTSVKNLSLTYQP